jgi:phosphate transport system substrate-binding protein
MKQTILVLVTGIILAAFILSACAPPPAIETTTESPSVQETQIETEAPMEETEAPMEETEAPIEETEEAPTEEVSPGIMLPEVDPAQVSGDIVTAGSSTVYPLTEAVVTLFESEGYSGKITIDSIGTGAGFERFCESAETDISNASRPIKEEEVAACQANGREPVEFRVGTDALAVAVSLENDFVQNLTLEQLALAFSTAETWADLDPAFPAEPIQRFSPGTDSGTFDYFVEAVMAPANGDDADAGEAAILAAQGIQFSEDDNFLVQGVSGSPYAIGYFGFAYAQANTDLIRPISVDGVEPNEDTAESNEYPLSRPLFIYSAVSVLQAKPQVADFINFYLTRVNEIILDVGYFPASAEALDRAKQAWLDATGQ